MLGFGDEKGLMSPLADAIMTAALYRLSFCMPIMMGVFGFGSDGELSKAELERSFGIIARNDGMLWELGDIQENSGTYGKSRKRDTYRGKQGTR